MKSVLISIQPKWCELIASGQKTVEVRKSKPKMIAEKEKADKAYYDLACEVEDLRAENERLKTSLTKYLQKIIVHCEDCHWGVRDVRGHIYCFKHAGCILRNNDDFCSCGKIK